MTTFVNPDGSKDEIPVWATNGYVDECAKDKSLQDAWEPKVGDWYFCGDLGAVFQIKTLEGYYSTGDGLMDLPSDRGKDSRGHWGCDTYLPEPNKVIASKKMPKKRKKRAQSRRSK